MSSGGFRGKQIDKMPRLRGHDRAPIYFVKEVYARQFRPIRSP